MVGGRALSWIASYPKSGNTWLRMLLQALSQPDRPLNINALTRVARQLSQRSLADAALGLDSTELTVDELYAARPAILEYLAATSHPGSIYKTHDRLGGADAPGAKAFARLTDVTVYVVRDPRDVAVSLAHHLGVGVEVAIHALADRDFVLGARATGYLPRYPQRVGSWSRHVTAWTENAELIPTVVRYEDLQACPEETLGRVARALGEPASAAALAAAVHACRFESVQAQEQTDGFVEAPVGRAFFRSGRSGQWSSVLTGNQAESIERAHGAVMARFGYV